jgi:hypothetical protein
MSDLDRQRCLFHPRREAVARCPGCGRYFCRECITEHRGRVICAACLNGAADGAGTDRKLWRRVVRPLQCGLGVLLVWMCFYYLGQSLIAIPSRFHDGSVWTKIAADGR